MPGLDDNTSVLLTNLVQAIGALNQTIARVLPQIQSLSTSATGGTATALPSQPAGYINTTLPDGTSAKIAFYR